MHALAGRDAPHPGAVPQVKTWGTAGFALLVVLAFPAAASAHTVASSTRANLWRDWSIEPAVVLPLVLGGWLFLRGNSVIGRHARTSAARRRALLFFAGIAAILIALCSPLDALSGDLLAAHMAQHMLLILVAAPLLVLGRPLTPLLLGLPRDWRRSVAASGRSRPIAAAIDTLTHPLVATTLQALVFWLWHLPPVYQEALRNDWLHALEHASFLGTALLFWWAVLPRRQTHRGAGVLAIVLSGLQNGILAALLTFSGSAWYPDYRAREAAWGLAPLTDQQLAGLIMWIPGGLLALGAALALVYLWLQDEERRADRSARSRMVTALPREGGLV